MEPSLFWQVRFLLSKAYIISFVCVCVAGGGMANVCHDQQFGGELCVCMVQGCDHIRISSFDFILSVFLVKDL